MANQGQKLELADFELWCREATAVLRYETFD